MPRATRLLTESENVPMTTLRLTPYAWAKLIHLRDLGRTEVGGFGISSVKDLLLIEDFCLIEQICSTITVKFNDEAVADFFDEQVDQGRQPEQFGRIWIHTHPGRSASPSCVDEDTFDRCFGRTDWAIMFIVARGGETYARLRHGNGPCRGIMLPVEIDFQHPFPATRHADWNAEYDQCVSEERWEHELPPGSQLATAAAALEEELADELAENKKRAVPEGYGRSFDPEEMDWNSVYFQEEEHYRRSRYGS